MILKKDLPVCPVATTIDLIGGKWKLLILRDIFAGSKRFNQLQKSLNGISHKVLTENLRQMEKDGVILRKTFFESPPRVEYSLSQLGETMRPIIFSMEKWGLKYLDTIVK